MTVADVVVVGGGPAGSAAAVTCATAGLDVVLLESSRDEGRHRPGETLHPGVEGVLASLGLGAELAAAGFLRHHGHWVQWGGPPRFQAFGSDQDGLWRGYQAPRDRLDALLLGRARTVGVDVRRPCRAVDALVTRGRVCGVATEAGDLRAQRVVDASGHRGWLARRRGLTRVACSPRLVAAYGHVTGNCPARDDAPLLRAESNGWTWTARVAAGEYAWVRLDLRSRDPREQRPDDLAGLTPRGRARAADVTWRLLPECSGPGYLVVGDAAALLDPAASHGVLRALVTGVLAGRTCVALRQSTAAGDAAEAGYRRWVEGCFRRAAARLGALYRVFPEWPSDGTAPRR